MTEAVVLALAIIGGVGLIGFVLFCICFVRALSKAADAIARGIQ